MSNSPGVAARKRPATSAIPRPSEGFRVERKLPVGRHPLLAAFPGLDKLPPALRIEADATRRSKLFGETFVEIVDEDMWMYVAPRELPKMPPAVRRRWKPVLSPGQDCIVVGAGHLRESSELVLFLDIYHELCHILQRWGGANLWEPGVSYTQRRTEIEAYRFVVEEGRSLGVPDAFLREYLRVEWISDEEHLELLKAVGVPSG
ncbi:MAG TPA: hypothetical protein VK423_05560 [Thermoplasmata archaeon]|nr:hypothetical protein [Thermoplasmata archaeon]